MYYIINKHIYTLILAKAYIIEKKIKLYIHTYTLNLAKTLKPFHP